MRITMAIAPTGLSRIFRKSEPDEAPEDAAHVALDGPALAAIMRTVELQLRQVPLDTLTAEVLPAMLAIFDAPAGALLLYRREDATLALAAARGLPVAAAEALDVLRWGDESGSEMPLRALVDRKIYVVDEPASDAFARRLTTTDDRRPLSSVAAVPLYRWQLPVAVLLVVGGETAPTSDALLAPTLAYDVLALALSTMLWARDDRGATPLPASDVAPPPLICVPWVDTRLEADSQRARLEAERDSAIKAAREEGRRALEASVAAARAEGQRELEETIAAMRAEGRAALDAGMSAARDESRSALDLMLQELRAAVSGMEAERQATAHERAALGDRLASFEQENHRLADQLANAERERTTFADRMASLEDDIAQRLERAMQAKAAALTAAAPAAPEPTTAAPISEMPVASTPPPLAPPVAAAPPPPRPPAATPAPPPSRPAAASPAPPAAKPAAAPPPVPAPTATAPAERRVLESAATLRDHIQTALASAIPAGRGSIAAVNLIGCDATRLADMTAAAEAGMTVVAYAADGERGSRILGPLRCFTTPPTAPEIASAIDGTKGNRRTITLSEDIDAFMVAKAALAKAGHSVSMACDEKQALDLLAILRPDTVLVDVRGTGEPSVEFLNALGPESGRILTLLVHGDPSGATLGRLAERMLRPNALDVNDLVKVCRNALPEAKRPGAPGPAKR